MDWVLRKSITSLHGKVALEIVLLAKSDLVEPNLWNGDLQPHGGFGV